MTKQLVPKIDRFVDEYLVDLNGTQAAIRAGYSEKTAAQQASRLLRNVKVQQAIATRQRELAERRGWDGTWKDSSMRQRPTLRLPEQGSNSVRLTGLWSL